MKDELGNEYLYAECEYYNDVTYGKFTLDKTGPELCGRNDKSGAEENEAADNTSGKTDIASGNLTGNNEQPKDTESNLDNTTEVTVNPFDYDDVKLNGVVFELTAKEDIMSQDNQGTVLFNKDSVVATITTGEKAEFTNDCNGICNYTVNADDTIKCSAW